jgi:hypothetical protein
LVRGRFDLAQYGETHCMHPDKSAHVRADQAEPREVTMIEIIEDLCQEHRDIEKLLLVLEREVSLFDRGGRPDYEVVRAVIEHPPYAGIRRRNVLQRPGFSDTRTS